MLSRSSSNTSNGLRRAKSASSVLPRYSTSNESSITYLERAHDQALAAASHAFEQAHARTSFSCDPQDIIKNSNVEDHPSSGLVRQKSVRFVGPTAVITDQRSITRRRPPPAESNSVPIDNKNRSIDVDRFVTALPQQDEIDAVTNHSSYRRLKKSKSMWSITKSSQWPFQFPSAESRRRRSYDPSLRHSFASGRSLTGNSQDHGKYAESDAAVRLARDQFASELEKQRLRKKASFMSLKRRTQSPKVFRISMRSSSIDSRNTDFVSTSTPGPRRGNFGIISQQARTLSSTMRSRVKRIFQKNGSVDMDMPTQHSDTNKPHFRDYSGDFQGTSQDHESIPSPTSDTILRANSRNSSLLEKGTFADDHLRPSSVRTIRSEGNLADNSSRITSWANSTQAESIPPSYDIYEKKRLSVIQEHGVPYQPSSSVLKHGVTGPAYSAFCRPPYSDPPIKSGIPPMDTESIYSALRKRLQEDLEDAGEIRDSSDAQPFAPNTLRMLQYPPRQTSSLGKEGRLLNSWAEENESGSDGVMPSQTRVPETPFEPTDNRSRAVDDDVFSPSSTDARSAAHGPSLRLVAPSEPLVSTAYDASSQQTPKKPLRDVRSTFFPPSTYVERQGTSPYRRAVQGDSLLQSVSDIDLGHQSHSHFSPVSGRIEHTPCSSTAGSVSVYSRSTGNDTPRAMGSLEANAKQIGNNDNGTATILRHPSPASVRYLDQLRQAESSTARSSGDWKRWMATEVAALDHYPPRSDLVKQRHVGHIREQAQIDPDDEASTGVFQAQYISDRDLERKALTHAGGEADNSRSNLFPTERSPLFDMRPACKGSPSVRNPTSRPLLQGFESPQSQKENTPPDRGESTNLTTTKYRRQSHGSPLNPLKGDEHVTSMQCDVPQYLTRVRNMNTRHELERVQRLRRIKSSLSNESPPTTHSEKSSLAMAAMEAMEKDTMATNSRSGQGQGLINFVLAKVRRDGSSTSTRSEGPAFM